MSASFTLFVADAAQAPATATQNVAAAAADVKAQATTEQPANPEAAAQEEPGFFEKLKNLFTGTITANRGLDAVVITVTDREGTPVQKCLCRPWRSREGDFAFQMQQFLDDGKEKTLGQIDLDALPAGGYTCTVTARAVGGRVFALREFTLEK